MAGEWIYRNDHPLLNNVILSKVFEFVRPTDLKECRVACKTWNVSTISFTRKTWIVDIYGNSVNWESELPWRIEKFLEAFRLNELGIPFARFQLGAFSMTDIVGQEFLRLCGEIAKEIDLTLGSDKFMVEDVSELLRSTPNLDKFKIPNHLHSRSSNIVNLFPDSPENPKPKLPFLKKLKSSDDFPDTRIEFCPSFLEELIAAAENISNLSIGRSYVGNYESRGKCTSLEVLTVIDKLGRESCIEILHLSDILKEHVQILQRMKSNGLKLKRIKVSRKFDDAHFVQVSSLFKGTIEYFRVSRSELCNNSVQFPKIPYLTFLEIRISKDFDLKNLNLSDSFPSLGKLEVDQFGFCKEYDELFCESDPCPKIESFKLCSPTIKITGFKRTLSLFPKLTDLYLHVSAADSSLLRNIWTEMTELEDLTLTFRIHTTENLDSIFTGISSQSLQEIEPLVNELVKMTREVGSETILRLRNEHSLLPSITNLTNLRRLELRVLVDGGDGPTSCLSDLTGYLGFYAMNELRHLDVSPCELTKTCCEILTTDTGLLSWTFRDTNSVNTIPRVAYCI